uniref:Uncharacterized protein n=1 Tax=Nitrosopumivirus cobalaminus TaxID=3158414 RepID=A0AAU7N4A4_9VIRU
MKRHTESCPIGLNIPYYRIKTCLLTTIQKNHELS